MKITFLLTGPGDKPIGGFKVVYEYANGLVARGHQVSVVHPARARVDLPWLKRAEKFLRYLRRRFDRSYCADSWFRLDERVNVLWVPSLDPKYIPDADAVIATAWTTAEWAARYPAGKGRRYYLLQHLETWAADERRIMDTWRLPLHKIVIARWLQQVAESMGERATYIPNGLDFNAFGIDRPIEDREPASALMLYHKADWKGSADGIAALELVHREIPELKATFFGIEPRPAGLPEWINYHRTPPQLQLRELYNHAAVFVGPSWTEGWGLPPAEAMICGCAVALTDNGGHREFAQHEVTALLSPPKDPAALAANIKRLITDGMLRQKIAHTGHHRIQNFRWDKSVAQLEQTLRN